jgi:hypothetical protein
MTSHTPKRETVRHAYGMWYASHVEPQHDEGFEEFDRWLASEQERAWDAAVEHLEGVIGGEMKRAARADNPYIRREAEDE